MDLIIKFIINIQIILIICFCGLWPLNLHANEVNHNSLRQQADEFLKNYKQDKYSVQQLDKLERDSQSLIKSLQNCEQQAENAIEQLAEIRNIEALSSDAKDSEQDDQDDLPKQAATAEVDRQINDNTKQLITCRLKSNQVEEARFEILEKKQQLWIGELTSRQSVWDFISQDKINYSGQALNKVLPYNRGFLLAALIGLSFYVVVLWRNWSRWFVFDSPKLGTIKLSQYFVRLLLLHGLPVVLAVAYYFWADINRIHALILAGGLLLRDACVLLPLKLLVKSEQKSLINKFMLFSTVLIIILAIGWNGINFKQNFGLGWIADYGWVITPLVLLVSVLFGFSNRYFYLLLKPYKDRYVSMVLIVFAAVSFSAYALTFAQGAQYLLIISVGLMMVHWLMKTINSVRKVALTHKIDALKDHDDYDGSNFSFPFWVSLLTVIISTVLGLVLLSFIAGVSEEAYKQVSFVFNEGFALGSVRIVPRDILIAVTIVALIIYGIQKLKFGIENRWFNKSRVRDSSREVLSMVVWYIGLTIAIFVGLSVAGFDISKLAIIAGALSVGIGFGLQNIVSNFVSGLILLFERPITRGDWVEVGDTVGLVEKVKIRATRIRTFDNSEILVPNSELLSHHVTNWTLSNSIGRITVKVGVAYGSDVDQVREILNDIASNHEQVMQREPYKHKVLFREFGDSSLNFELRVMIKNIKLFLDVESELNFTIDQALRDAEITIPFPQRDLHIIDSSVIPVEAPEAESETETEDASKNDSGSDSQSDASQKNQPQASKSKTNNNKISSNNEGNNSNESDKDEVEQMIEEDERRKEEEKREEIEKAKNKDKTKG